MRMQRSTRWDDVTWAALERLADESPVWQKPAAAPEMFAVSSRGVALADYLRRRGLDVSPPPRGEGDAWVPIPGRMMIADLVRGQLTETVGRYPDAPLTWRALALAAGEVPSRRVTARDGELEVTVSLAHRAPMRRDTLEELARSVERVRTSLEDHASSHGGGYADLVDALVAAGLTVPPVPATLRACLRRHGGWRWSSLDEREQPSSLDDYLFQTEWLHGMVPDHVTVSHGGHGINSYALTLRLAWGPVAIAVQEAWGGLSSSEHDAAALARTFFSVSRVLEELEQLPPVFDMSPRFRPIVVTYSGLREGLRCLQWDARLRAMVEVKLPEDDPWEHVAGLAAESGSGKHGA